MGLTLRVQLILPLFHDPIPVLIDTKTYFTEDLLGGLMYEPVCTWVCIDAQR